MKKILCLTLCLLFTLTLPAMAGSPKMIALKDGSTVQGRIVGIDNGRYVVESPSFGEVRIKEDDIVSITSPGEISAQQNANSLAQTGSAIPNQSGENPYAGQMQAMQNKIASDPSLMSDIQALTQDPDVMAALGDPAFLEAARSGNIQALQSSPQTQRLLNSPKMQALMQKIQSQQQ